MARCRTDYQYFTNYRSKSMTDTNRQKENMYQEQQRNAPGSDRNPASNQQTSQYANRDQYQNTHNKADENPEPGRRR